MNIGLDGCKPILDIKNLGTAFTQKGKQALQAVDGINLSIYPGEVHGLVGECLGSPGIGKSPLGMLVGNSKARYQGGSQQWLRLADPIPRNKKSKF